MLIVITMLSWTGGLYKQCMSISNMNLLAIAMTEQEDAEEGFVLKWAYKRHEEQMSAR